MGFHIAFGPDGDLIATARLSAVPPHSPYKVGDWVVMHGFDGAPPWHRIGWRGFVLGSLGSTLLRGLTEDGQEWAEYWGALQPDGTPGYDNRCNCCPHPRQRRGPEQLTLFDALEAS